MEATHASPDPSLTMDQRVTLHGVTWKQYLAFLTMRGDTAGVRVAYLDGELELMTPSRDHEAIKTTIARLLEAWAEEAEVDLNGFGSWTLRKAPRKRAAEPDECYVIGQRRAPVPDLAIEVMWTPGGLDKLELYRGLGVREIWLWNKGLIEVYALRRKGYERCPASVLFPALDLSLLERFLKNPNQSQAVRSYRAALRHN